MEGFMVWTLRCPRCKGLQNIYKENPLLSPLIKCFDCGEMSSTRAWTVVAMEYRTPEPQPLNKCFICGAIDCELEHEVVISGSA